MKKLKKQQKKILKNSNNPRNFLGFFLRKDKFMKIISWNVNGLRACIQKGFYDFFKNINADIFCVQETKMQEGQLDLKIEGYHYYINSAIKKGYSGTLIYTKEKPINVIYGINDKYNDEGRIITLEYNNFYLVN